MHRTVWGLVGMLWIPCPALLFTGDEIGRGVGLDLDEGRSFLCTEATAVDTARDSQLVVLVFYNSTVLVFNLSDGKVMERNTSHKSNFWEDKLISLWYWIRIGKLYVRKYVNQTRQLLRLGKNCGVYWNCRKIVLLTWSFQTNYEIITEFCFSDTNLSDIRKLYINVFKIASWEDK